MLSRTDNITRSLQDWVKTKLNAAGYSGKYVFESAYPKDRQSPLDKTIVVFAHDTTDEPQEAELGGPLTMEDIHFQVDVLGQSLTFGRNMAAIVREAVTDGEPIPLNDYSTDPPTQVDSMVNLVAVHTTPKFVDPEPWQQHWNVVTITVNHEYNRSYLG